MTCIFLLSEVLVARPAGLSQSPRPPKKQLTAQERQALIDAGRAKREERAAARAANPEVAVQVAEQRRRSEEGYQKAVERRNQPQEPLQKEVVQTEEQGQAIQQVHEGYLKRKTREWREKREAKKQQQEQDMQQGAPAGGGGSDQMMKTMMMMQMGQGMMSAAGQLGGAAMHTPQQPMMQQPYAPYQQPMMPGQQQYDPYAGPSYGGGRAGRYPSGTVDEEMHDDSRMPAGDVD